MALENVLYVSILHCMAVEHLYNSDKINYVCCDPGSCHLAHYTADSWLILKRHMKLKYYIVYKLRTCIDNIRQSDISEGKI